jgi:hypothetical protein
MKRALPDDPNELGEVKIEFESVKELECELLSSGVISVGGAEIKGSDSTVTKGEIALFVSNLVNEFANAKRGRILEQARCVLASLCTHSTAIFPRQLIFLQLILCARTTQAFTHTPRIALYTLHTNSPFPNNAPFDSRLL